jgi:hypothetical protein
MTHLSLRELLGIVVRDLITAEAQAAKASAGFLREAGFNGGREDSDDWGTLRFVKFSFTVQDPDGEKERTFRVPLLSLLPIPLQQIDQAEYEFFAKVNEVITINPTHEKSVKLASATNGLSQPLLDLMCEVAPYASESAPDTKSAVPKVRVKLTMRQADLPAGLASSLRIIEQASGSLTPQTKKPRAKR